MVSPSCQSLSVVLSEAIHKVSAHRPSNCFCRLAPTFVPRVRNDHLSSAASHLFLNARGVAPLHGSEFSRDLPKKHVLDHI